MSENVERSAETLLPCPFCGGDAQVCEAKECGPDAYVASCVEPTCMASSAVVFACGDDPEPLLIELWNRRVSQ